MIETTDGIVGREASVTERLADFTAQRPGPLPEDVDAKIRLHVLDTLGCQVAFASLPWSRAARNYAVADAAAGPATLAHCGMRTTAEKAAFANATFGHGFEMDDTEMRTASHPGVVVVPAALATGQVHRASGADFLRSVATGYELMVRVGLGSVGMMRRGFHTTAVAGVFGAAAAAASIKRLDAGRTAHALGIAASRASGITEYSGSGGSVKRVHAGFAAQAGLEAAGLAAAGITAPSAALEGRRGFLTAFSDGSDAAVLTEGLGERYELLTTGLKPYCCCAGQHTVLDAVVRLQREHPALGSGAVRRIRVLQNPREADVVGRIVEPTDITGAQFSAAFGIGLRLVAGGNGFADYLSASLDDERILGVARSVVYERTEAGAPLLGEGPARVTVEFADGCEAAVEVGHARGTPQNPMSEAEVVAKFHSLADRPLGPERAARLEDMVLNLDRLGDVNELAALLVARPDDEQPHFDGAR